MSAEAPRFVFADFDAAAIPQAIRNARRARSATIRWTVRRLMARLAGRPVAPGVTCAAFLPYDELDRLLALNDNQLEACGYRRPELQAFRDSQTVFLPAARS